MVRAIKSVRSACIVASLSMFVAACGGGGGGGSPSTPTPDPVTPTPAPPTPVPDTTPDAFTFAAVADAEPSATVASESITVAGTNTDAPISVTNGQYAIAGGEFMSADGTIGVAQSVVVNGQASATFGESVTVTLNIGGVESNFVITTRDQDVTPNTFSFASATDVALSTTTASAAVTIEGIDNGAPISITGTTNSDAEYSVDGGDFTATAGTINPGQTLAVRVTSSAEFSSDSVATVTIGSTEVTFTVTTLAQDLAPEAFSFTPVQNLPFAAVTESNAITVAGINDASPISITGGEYAIGSNAFTSDAGTINNGDTVRVRVTAESAFSATVTATLTIGGVEGVFTATTLAQDITPDAFSFATVTNVAQTTIVESAMITVAGINDAASISIAGGEYSINGAAFTSTAGNVAAGNTVRVRVTTSADFSTDVSATLTIGGVNGIFTATTLAQDITPDAFAFTAQTDVARSTAFDSNTITVAGINDAAPISIAGGSYSINSGAFVSTAGTVEAGDTVQVRVTSSAAFSTDASATLTIGGVDDAFTVTTLAQDITPDAFSFTAQTDVAINTSFDSNTITVAGINDAAAISVAGGTYSINSGAFVSTAGTVEAGDTVQVRVTSSTDFSTGASATLTIGGVNGAFTVTTEAEDATPNVFTFATAVDVAPSTVAMSNTVTIEGINTAADVTVTSGEYSIDGGVFTSAAGTITSGQTIAVRGTSSGTSGADATVALNVGTTMEIFTITTAIDNTPPTATIAFPPPASMTEGATVTVRGTSADDFNVVSTVQVNGVAATDTSTDGDFSTWTVSVPLSPGDNTLTVTLQDAAGNDNDSAGSVAVRRDATLGDFPDSNNPLSRAVSLAIDTSNNRLLIGDTDLDAIIAMDMSTGARTVFSDSTTPDATNLFGAPEGLLVDSANNRVFVGDLTLDAILIVSLTDGSRTILSDDTTPDTNLPFTSPRELIFDPNNANRLLVSDSAFGITTADISTGVRTVFSSGRSSRGPVPDNINDFFGGARGIIFDADNNRFLAVDQVNIVFELDPTTGARTIFSNATVPNSDAPLLNDSRTLVLDSERNRILVSNDGTLDGVIAIDLDTGVRSLFSSPTVPDSINVPMRPEEIFFDGTLGYAFLVDRNLDGVFAIDIVSGERVIVTRGDSAD